jgi:electron transport complex protein RnfC
VLARQGVSPEVSRLILGGPMMGIAQGTTDVPLIKGTNAILAYLHADLPPQRDCIRCGRCYRHCPLGLMPGEMSIAAERGDWDAAVACGMMECKECGCCVFVCPARRPIVQLVKLGKAELRRARARRSGG